MKSLRKNSLGSIKNFACQQLFPGWYADYANKMLETIIQKNKKKKVIAGDKNSLDKVEFERLKTDFAKQGERKKNLEDKAKSVLGTISISIAAITFTLGFKGLEETWISIRVMLILSVFYFISATIRAIQSLNLRAFYTYQIEIAVDDETISYQKQGDFDDFETLLKFKVLNDSILSKIANSTYASYVLVRNAIVLFGLFFLLELLKRSL